MEAAAAQAIRRNDLDLVVVDEGDWLNVDSFELLRHIFDRTGCPIVVVGLPRILRVIKRHEKFVSRIGLHMEFLPLTQEEVLTTVLPALTLPLWQYHADNPSDQEMGAQLWQRVCPSLRKLRVVLQYASQIACARGAERITAQILAEALQLILIPQLPGLRRGPKDPQGLHNANRPQTPHSQEGEQNEQSEPGEQRRQGNVGEQGQQGQQGAVSPSSTSSLSSSLSSSPSSSSSPSPSSASPLPTPSPYSSTRSYELASEQRPPRSRS